MSERLLGEIWSYEDLHRVMRARANELQLSRETIDAIAGVQPGYAAKLLSPRPMKKLGSLSMSLIFPALGMKLIAVVDEEKTRDLQGRSSFSTRMGGKVRDDAVNYQVSKRFLRKIGRKGGANSRLYMSKKRASELGRKAVMMRWHKPKLTEIKGKKAKAILAATRGEDTT